VKFLLSSDLQLVHENSNLKVIILSVFPERGYPHLSLRKTSTNITHAQQTGVIKECLKVMRTKRIKSLLPVLAYLKAKRLAHVFLYKNKPVCIICMVNQYKLFYLDN